MAVQTAYSSTLAIGFAGQVMDTSPATIVSRSCDAAIDFGKVAVQGATDYAVRLPGASYTKFVGIAVRDQAADATGANQYKAQATGGFIAKGAVAVLAGEAVAAGDPVYFVNASGALVKTSTNATLIANARWETSAASGALAIIRLG